jgi:ABC-type antimicrobial peptide transport system permease subunit
MRRLVAEADPNLPIFQVRSMEERLAESMADHRLYTFLLGLFAATALTLAAVGTYGVLAYSASQRVREVGIRMALGASRERIVTLLLRQGLGLALAGLLLGGLAAAWAGELLSTWLFGLEPTDPLTLAATALLLGAAAVAASLSPALRASRVEPVETLQQE